MTHSAILLLFLILFLIVMCAAFAAVRNGGRMYEDEITTTTTTTTTNEGGIPIVGNLRRQYEGSQPYVMDPVDGDKVWLNTKDDMYEDGDGKFWRLI